MIPLSCWGHVFNFNGERLAGKLLLWASNHVGPNGRMEFVWGIKSAHLLIKVQIVISFKKPMPVSVFQSINTKDPFRLVLKEFPLKFLKLEKLQLHRIWGRYYQRYLCTNVRKAGTDEQLSDSICSRSLLGSCSPHWFHIHLLCCCGLISWFKKSSRLDWTNFRNFQLITESKSSTV